MIEDLPTLAAIGLGLLGALGGVIVALLRSHTAPRSQVIPPDSRPIDLAVEGINRSAARDTEEIDLAVSPGQAAREARSRRNRGRD